MARTSKPAGVMLKMPIWDLPTRLFHWVLVLAVLFSYLSYRYDNMPAHVISGHFIMALLIFRVVWGFVGSDTARFGRFLKSPLAALRHLAHFRRREPDTQVGHNEAGGWMVILLLLLLIVQVATGLCANDDALTEGPLAKHIDKATSDWLSHIHSLNFRLIEIAVLAHVLAVIAYAVVKRHDLVRPMLNGTKRLPAATPAPRMVHPLAALVVFVLALAIAAAVMKLV